MAIINKIKKLPKLQTMIDDSLQGNINTIYLKKIQSTEASDLFIAKGANVHRYYIDNNMFFGLDNSITKQLVADNMHAGAVIATQNITGTTDKFRIHATIVECKKTNFVFLHSVNILYLPNPRTAYLILACLNSKLLDWLFRKTSTIIIVICMNFWIYLCQKKDFQTIPLFLLCNLFWNLVERTKVR